MCQGYSAVLLPQLLHGVSDSREEMDGPTLRINAEEASWIGKSQLPPYFKYYEYITEATAYSPTNKR